MQVGIADFTVVGTLSLVIGDKTFIVQVDTDKDHLKKSVSHLEAHLNCLAEVFLLNQKGLDLILLRQGIFCTALGETCFYFSESGKKISYSQK